MPEKKAAAGLKTAKRGPSNAYVAMTESTPVVGVDTRKLKTELLLAPSFFKDDARGITPQEHTGSGMPNKVAFIIDPNLDFPRWLSMNSRPRNVWTKPAKKRP